MNEAVGFPWGTVISYFLWILGLAVILAVLSYYDFLTHRKEMKWKEVSRQDLFRKANHVALILIAVGLTGSLHNPLLAGLCGAGTFLLLILFIRPYIKAHRTKAGLKD